MWWLFNSWSTFLRARERLAAWDNPEYRSSLKKLLIWSACIANSLKLSETQDSNGITFPISYNGNNDQVVDFGVIGVPETIFISKNMNMTKKIIGPFDEKELVGSLEEIHIQ